MKEGTQAPDKDLARVPPRRRNTEQSPDPNAGDPDGLPGALRSSGQRLMRNRPSLAGARGRLGNRPLRDGAWACQHLVVRPTTDARVSKACLRNLGFTSSCDCLSESSGSPRNDLLETNVLAG